MIATLSMQLVLLMTAAAPKGPTCLTGDARVEKVVSSKARELKGTEYCQLRKYQTLKDVDSDGKDDFLLVFSIEGGEGSANDPQQFLAAFLSATGWKSSVVPVGKRGIRGPVDIDADKGVVVLSTSDRPEGQVRFRVVDGRLEPVDK